jgi:hypothetical protein
MVKRLLRRQLVDTLHTKRSERLFSLLKSSLRNERWWGRRAWWRSGCWSPDSEMDRCLSASGRIVSEARGRPWSNFLPCGRQPDVKGAALTFLAAHLK